jgi:hypothetical protein
MARGPFRFSGIKATASGAARSDLTNAGASAPAFPIVQISEIGAIDPINNDADH